MPRLRMAVVVATVLVSFVVTPLASAATDTTRPKLNLPKFASFLVGSAIGPMAADPADGSPVETSDILMTTTWSATDASGICGYRFRAEYAGSGSSWGVWGNQTSATYSTTDYDDQEGGGSFKFEGISVQTRDCAGNLTAKFSSFFPVVYQDDGSSYGYGSLSTLYTGTWGTSKCLCWSGGSTRKTSAYGARVDFTFDQIIDPSGSHPVALIMERAPDRGKAQILIDGVYRATIDTYAPSPTHRSVVWSGKLSLGAHTLTVVNLATTSRPRIDVDAVMVSG